jgi:hypothetical protein
MRLDIDFATQLMLSLKWLFRAIMARLNGCGAVGGTADEPFFRSRLLVGQTCACGCGRC